MAWFNKLKRALNVSVKCGDPNCIYQVHPTDRSVYYKGKYYHLNCALKNKEIAHEIRSQEDNQPL